MAAMLTPELFHVYRTYKRKTNKVVSWLLLKVSSISGAKAPVNQIIAASKGVLMKGLQLPDELYWDLRDAVKARSEITEVYKHKSIEENGTHEHFTSKLRETLTILFPHPPLLTPVSASQSTDTRNESEIPVHNPFELL